MRDKARVNVLFQTQGPRENHEKHKSQSKKFEPALNLAGLYWRMISFYWTSSENPSTLKKQSNIVELCETISYTSFTETLEGLQLVPKLSATGFRSKNVSIETKPMKTAVWEKKVIPRENGTCSLGSFHSSWTLDEKRKKKPCCNSLGGSKQPNEVSTHQE